MDTITLLDTVAERIEQELARVRAARPSLASRISRAENILVTHLTCRRSRVIRVRVNAAGARFLVASQGSKGAVYVVEPGSWSCTCPDAQRRGKACKHSIACWSLFKAGVSSRRGTPPAALAAAPQGYLVEGVPEDPRRGFAQRRCDGRGDLFAQRGLIEAGPEQAEWTLTAFEGDELCISGGCAVEAGIR